MKLLLCFGILLLAGIQVANSSPLLNALTKDVKRPSAVNDGKVLIEDGNEFVDAILEQLRIKAIEYGLDPMQLPDELYGFSITFLFIRYHGELWFQNGWLQNLSTIVRAGEAEVSQKENIMEIRTYVRFDQLFMQYQYKAKIMNVGPKGDVIGYVKDLLLSVDLLVDLDTCDATLKDIFISDSGKLDIHLDGTWFFDEIWNAMIDVFTWMFKNVIMNLIESKIRETIELTLPGMDFAEVTGVACGPARISAPAVEHQIVN